MATFCSTTISSDLIERQISGAASWNPRDGVTRDRVIVDVANLEAVALAAIRRFAESIRPADQTSNIDAAMRAADLTDGTSLRRLAGLLFLLNLIDSNIHHDLRKLYELSTAYAHKASAGYLGTDTEMTKLLHDCNCYKANRTALAVLDTQGKVYRAIAAHLQAGLSGLA